MSFVELFGDDHTVLSEGKRHRRWRRWKSLMKKLGEEERELVEIHEDVTTCIEDGKCRHLKGDWCGLIGLPANIDPYLGSHYDVMTVGMACSGGGKTS